MIKINNKEYKLEKMDCYWDTSTRVYNSNIKTGLAPRLFFLVDEESCYKELLIELSLIVEEFENMLIGQTLDLKKEVTDIGYTDNAGWLTLIETSFMFKLTKLDLNRFLMEFKCNDSFENISFEIDEEISLMFPQKH